MSVIGEAAFSMFLDMLLGKLASSALNFVADYSQVHEQLKEWKSKLPYLQAVLNDAEEKQIKQEGVKNWLDDVQDLAYDVDDILDEFAYEALRLKLQQAEAEASTSKVRKLIPTCCTSYFSPTSVMFRTEMISKIKDITARLNNLASQTNLLKLREIVSEGASSKQGKKSKPLQHTSLMDETVEYVGRENEKLQILYLLKSRNTDGASVISIVGLGGMGKTTLAQLVYNDASIKDSLDHKAWVCVSDDFDAVNITKTILRSIDAGPCDDNDLNLLQVKLKEKLSGKRFLLVLDDIWNESYNDWTILRSPFGVGTKIIVTTRSQIVSSNVDPVEVFRLDKLSFDDCLCIFAQHALRARDFSRHLEFKEVGENIVRRCGGLPLAAKAMGGLLRTIMHQGPGGWEKIYESEIWDLPEEQGGVIPALRLSYYHLPSHLKRCFAYCSILPKDYEFEEEEMILLWRAEGFLQQKAKSQTKDLENQCFQDLVSRSFFQKSSKNKSRYVMHDLMNDLAQLVAGKICFKLEGDKQQKISNRTRYFSYVRGKYDGVKKFDALDQVSALRTFLPLETVSHRSYLSNVVLNDLLPRLKCLRALSLNGYSITELPDLFENSKHLRYLNFSGSLIKCLPGSLCTLYHLETLILRGCVQLEKLPSEIGNLKELHYLDIRGSYSIKGMHFGVGKLTNLQRLSDFIIGEGEGHHIREMKNLSELRGDFCLSGLENVKGQDAREARLNEKSGIDRLTLKWCRDFESDRSKEDEERVLNFLRPQKKLEQLIIENYGGAKFSAWIADSSSLKNLLSLELRNCRNCKSLPSIGRLPMLKDVLISGMNEVNKVGAEFLGENKPNVFASLETLHFEDMPYWKEWDPCEGEFSVFPKLVRFHVKNCPELLGRLPSRLHSLQKLEIKECRRLVVSISSFPSLREIEISGCEELVDTCSASGEVIPLQKVSLTELSKFSIPLERIMSRFANSEYIEIKGWMELAYLSQNGFGLVGHRFITIENCPQLVSLETEEEGQLQVDEISCIELLTIENCERLNRLPLKFLKEMRITGCPSLVCFAESNLPPTLKRLEIDSCENLKADVLNGLRLLSVGVCPKLTSIFSNAKLPTKLENLQIWFCEELECIAQEFPQTSTLQSIILWLCGKIKCLPRGLDKLTHLQTIQIYKCSNLVTFKESGPQPPSTLGELFLSSCSADVNFAVEDLPTNLTKLRISNAPKIYRSLVEGGIVDRLTSLQKLYIGGEGCSDVCFPKEDMMLPASLTDITIAYFENMEYMLSNAFQNLTSFESLSICGCSKLKALPEKDILLLEIEDCPLLKENCKRDEGREWSKIAHLPRVVIDGEEIIPQKHRQPIAKGSFQGKRRSHTDMLQLTNIAAKRPQQSLQCATKMSEQSFIDNKVTADGNLITGRDPGTSMEFALGIVKKYECLSGPWYHRTCYETIQGKIKEYGDRIDSPLFNDGGEGCSDVVSFPKEKMMLLASLTHITSLSRSYVLQRPLKPHLF
ncbi:hypothetical protein PTKIN_Ptkin14bG0142700 [Pterospermum kingtungense]